MPPSSMMREGEKNGVDYEFLSRQEFEARRDRGEFLEWAEYSGHLYGTLRAPLEAALAAGQIYVLEIEVDGTQQLRDQAVEQLQIVGRLDRQHVFVGIATAVPIPELVLWLEGVGDHRLERGLVGVELAELVEAVDLGTGLGDRGEVLGHDPGPFAGGPAIITQD